MWENMNTSVNKDFLQEFLSRDTYTLPKLISALSTI